MIENIEGLGAQIQGHPLGKQPESALDKWGHIVDRCSKARIARNHYTVDHWTIRGCACVAAIGRSGHDIVGQAASECSEPAEVDSEGRDECSTQHESPPLVVDRGSVLLESGKVRIIR